MVQKEVKPNKYRCTNKDCGAEYWSTMPVCKLRCPCCNSKHHKLLKIGGDPKDFKF